MARASYPLAPALQARDIARTRAELELARVLTERDRAIAAVDAAQLALDAHARQHGHASVALLRPEAASCISGEALTRTAAFARRQSEAARVLRDRARRAREQLSVATRELARAQAAFAHALGSQRALELDRTRFEHAGRARDLRREQDEHDERAANFARPRARP